MQRSVNRFIGHSFRKVALTSHPAGSSAKECYPEHVANSFSVTHILLASRGDDSGGFGPANL